jgi:Family of unknown function (DUF5681)
MKRSTRKPSRKRNQDDYEVGFARPPRAHQFKKGISGNKKGQSRGTKNIATLFHQEMYQKVTILENGQRRTITKIEAALKQLTNKAATGDPRAIQAIINMASDLGDLKHPDPLQEPQRRKLKLNIFTKDLQTGQHVRVNTSNVREADDDE